jgi:Protein of unknown function (DUF3047)
MIVSNALVKVGHCQVNYNHSPRTKKLAGGFAFVECESSHSFLTIRSLRFDVCLMECRNSMLRLFLLVLSLISAVGCATTSTALPVEVNVIADQIPSLTAVDGRISSLWRPVSLPLKRKTDYRAVKYKGKSAVRANARSSASGLEAKLNVDLTRKPKLSFSWYADSLIAGADNAEKATEDSPLRIVLSFAGDKDTLSGKEQRFHERAKFITGRELPFATLMYIWENQKPVGTVITNPHTATIKKIVIASGEKDLKKWTGFQRNIVEDYLLAFGKQPGKLVGIALMSDTDNTGTNVMAYYGDVTLNE